jgi:CHAD domain-containing protein
MSTDSTAEPPATAQNPAAPPEPPGDLQLLLDLPDIAIAELKHLEFLTSAAQRRPTTRRLRQVYWDTADHRLGRAGLAVATQTAGTRRTQVGRNIRLPPAGGRVLHQQDGPLDSDGLDLTRLALLPGSDPTLVTRLAAEMFVPVFALDLARTSWPLVWGETQLTLALETGAIDSTAGTAQFCQIGLNLTGGPPPGLYDFAERLLRALPARLAAHDPVQLGYRLIAGADWWPTNRNGTAALSPDMTVRQGVMAIGRAATSAVRAEVAALAESIAPAQIHETRVALRRLRSVLSAFRAALPDPALQGIGRELGALAKILGRARELDVFLAETLDPLSQASGEETALRGLRLTAAVLRENAAATARKAACTAEFAGLSCRLGAWFDAGLWPEPSDPAIATLLDQPFTDYAEALLRKDHRKLLAAAAVKDPNPAELHALRIRAKRLRYAAEFVRSLFRAGRIKPYLSALKEIQEVLGALNDAVAARNLLPQLTERDPTGGARASGLVAGWTAAEVNSARRRFAETWRDFTDTKRFWK